MEILQEKNSRAGVIGTILFHLLLLLLFIQFGMTYQDPPEENAGGMVINFGTTDEGMGDIQPSSTENTTTSENATQSETTTPSSAQENALTTTEESVEMNASQNTTTTTNQNTTTQQTEQTVDENLSNALNALNNPNNNSTGDGNTGTPGDQGDENGDPNSSNYTGGGTVNGVGVHFEGGTLEKKIIPPKNPTQEGGTVVVKIWVDKNGTVTRAEVIIHKKTTTTNAILEDISEKAAKKATFKMEKNAPPIQIGTMTFVYILN
jgi:periplasmic protein TonB